MDTRQPITPDILKGLKDQWGQVCTDHYEAALFHVVALVAFFAVPRISELAARAKSNMSDRALWLADVQPHQDIYLDQEVKN